MFVVGIDVGGTFTDVTAVDGASGRVVVTKVPSQPNNEAAAVLAGLDALGIDGRGVRRLVHGTTVGTNAILERRGARVALITTAGFRDLIEIGRTKRNIPVLFVPTFVRPKPFVERALRFEVDERMLHDGAVLTPLRGGSVDRVIDSLGRAAPEALAVCLLHAYANSAHERAVGERFRERFPEVPVSLSSDVVPEYREFERFSTTVLNAYLQPLMDRYLAGLEKKLFEAGYAYGVLTIAAGGVSQGCFTAARAGITDFITYDMGGTSTDVCLVRDGRPLTTTDNLIAAFPVKVAQIDIRTVGAGGGSIAWLDVDGALQVGPRSAGAQPGPAAYGLGGVEPTVTDANIVLGRMSTERPLGGALRIHADLARNAVAALAARLRLDRTRLAEGIIDIAVARMTASIREISIQQGHDPRDFTLIAFGGAGPMHAIPVAEELGIPRVLVPRHPGNFSALGLLVSDVKHDDVRTRVGRLHERVPALEAAFAEMSAAAARRLDAEGFDERSRRTERSLDLRYAGQAFELSVPLPPGTLDAPAIIADFNARHLATYGHADPDGDVEVVNARMSTYGVVDKPDPSQWSAGGGTVDDARIATRDVWFAGRAAPTPVYERDRLPGLARVDGPAIVEEFGATTVVFPAWRARLDGAGHLVLERGT